MKLYIRSRSGIWINFINSIDELKEFEANLIPGRHLVIGDIATFTTPMKNMLLKLCEEHPTDIDCYSSIDVCDPILLSRFVEIDKELLYVTPTHSVEEWETAKHDYMNAEQLMGGCTNTVKLRLPGLPSNLSKLLQLL